ncbi:MAG: hypothetical protein ABH821_00740 [archaeon]
MAHKLYLETLNRFKRIGDSEKIRFLESLDKKILPSQKNKIVENDKSITRELFLPSWVSWELIRSWAVKDLKQNTCVFCNQLFEDLKEFKGKSICSYCLQELVSGLNASRPEDEEI